MERKPGMQPSREAQQGGGRGRFAKATGNSNWSNPPPPPQRQQEAYRALQMQQQLLQIRAQFSKQQTLKMAAGNQDLGVNGVMQMDGFTATSGSNSIQLGHQPQASFSGREEGGRQSFEQQLMYPLMPPAPGFENQVAKLISAQRGNGIPSGQQIAWPSEKLTDHLPRSVDHLKSFGTQMSSQPAQSGRNFQTQQHQLNRQYAMYTAPPKPKQSTMAAEQKGNAFNGAAQIAPVNSSARAAANKSSPDGNTSTHAPTQTQPPSSAEFGYPFLAAPPGSSNFPFPQLPHEMQNLWCQSLPMVGNRMFPITCSMLPSAGKKVLENVSAANGAGDIQSSQRDVSQVFQRLKNCVRTMPPDVVKQVAELLQELQNHWIWIPRNARLEKGSVGGNNAKENVPDFDLGEKATNSIITDGDEQQTLKQEVDSADQRAVTPVANVQSEAAAEEEEQQQQKQIFDESAGESDSEAESYFEEVSIDGDDELLEWVFI